MSANLVLGAGGAISAYDIDNSLRWNSGDSAKLTRTPGTATSNRIGTLSWWMKQGNIPAESSWGMSNYLDEGNRVSISTSADALNMFGKVGGTASKPSLTTTQLFRDSSAWYHIIYSIDVTQATGSDRIKLYVNGEQVTSFSEESYPDQNVDFPLFSKANMLIGARYAGSITQHTDGYMAEFYYIDGTAELPSSFGELNSTTNQWIPKDAVDDLTFGDNGFYQKYGNTADPLDIVDIGVNTLTIVNPNNATVKTTSQKKAGDSSLFFDGSAYLKKDNNGVTNGWSGQDTDGHTIEMWVRPDSATSGVLVANYYNSIGYFHITMNADNTVSFYWKNSNAAQTNTGIYNYTSTGTLADNTWTHMAFSWVGVGSNPSTDNILRFYLNGVQDGTATGSGVQGASTGKVPWAMWGSEAGGNQPLFLAASYLAAPMGSGYIDQIRFSDVERYPDGTTFTVPTTAFVSDSNTALLIQPIFAGGLGKDSSGNANGFNIDNLTAGDKVLDSPTNNWATCRVMNSPISSGASFTQGNLYFASGTTGGGRNTDRMSVSTILANSGKWYAECMVFSTTSFYCGVGPNQVGTAYTTDNTRYAYIYGVDGQKLVNTDGSEAFSTYGSGFSTGDIVQIYIDMDASTPEVFFGKNGSWGDGSGNFDETTPTSAVVLGSTFFTDNTANPGYFEFQFSSSTGGTSAQGQFNFGQDSTFSSQTAAGGYSDTNEIGDFKYTVPSGAKALCVDNLPDPEIALPGEYFNTAIYTGTGSELAITGVGFQPDFTWIKTRTLAYNNRVMDSVRDQTYYELYTNTTGANVTSDTETLKSFDSDGFTLGTSSGVNPVSTMVSWNWKAGGAPTADNDNAAGAVPDLGSVMINGVASTAALAGTIAATRLSANTTSGFSIAEWVGTGSSGTIAHGLTEAPDLVIAKSSTKTSTNWVVGATAGSVDFTDFLIFNSDVAIADDPIWNDADPSSTVFSIGTDGSVNTSTYEYIAYCFHSVEGYSKVGIYVGNTSTDGATVYTGFRPAFVLLKCTTSTANWILMDDKRPAYNVVDEYLYPDIANATAEEATADFLSNGFKLRNTGVSFNRSGDTYIFIAFASSPFKTSNAR